MPDIRALIDPLLSIHCEIRDAVIDACERRAIEDLSGVDHDTVGDTIYAVDRISEERLIALFERDLVPHASIVLVAEGLPHNGKRVLPDGLSEEDAEWRVIVDPIDGTRGLMYQKRSAWILTGVAPNRGPDTGLQDIVLAVQTEIPLIKQHLTDQVWAIRGESVQATRLNRLSGEEISLQLKPSSASTIEHGFASFARFFPGVREPLAAIDEEIVASVLGPVQPGKAHTFEDQYISTGGQLYELIAGHDRFVADLRPLIEPLLAEEGLALGLCCHPYDICTSLIAEALGVVVCAPDGSTLRAPLGVEPDVAWVGYANDAIREEVEASLIQTLRKRQLLQP
jgi:fructose-1,6-bisphosphatase/inositol monophosphatase family enzyme